MRNPPPNRFPMHIFIILRFLLSFTAAVADAAAVDDPNYISINCGGASAATALTGRNWLRDAATVGSSITATAKGELFTAVDPVPYKTARISRSKFSYSFPTSPGQKFIRLHFNPALYHGFQSFNDLFTVEAGPFVLLANFSASLTARALSVNTFVKEFCVTLQENQPLTIVFSPETNSNSKDNYAFINGIEIISVPSAISYCHGGDSGVRVLSRPWTVFSFDNTTALERVHRQHIKWGSASSRDDIGGMFGMWYSYLEENAAEEDNAMIWRVSVDVGFRYLVRLHFCEVEHQMDFRILIDDMVAFTSADMLQQRGDQSFLWYETYMVMVEGRKREDKRSISISLNSQHEYMDRHGPLEGFEVFKLSNHDHSLASPNPNPLPPRRDSSSQTIRALLGRENAIATLVFIVICLVNTIVWGANFFKEKNKPSVWSKQLCRRFSLAEIISATENFQHASVLGNGGFGEVYKGCIDNGRNIVAIKRLKLDSKLGEHQFATEVETLAKLRHINLVSLIGYCREKREMMFVYEYMGSGTLADHLHKQVRKGIDFLPLSWEQRLKICIGVGRALDYLHTGHGVIHGDLKPSNILLDENLVPKISNFGSAKLVNDSEWQSQDSTTLVGRLGYMDQSYYQTGEVTRKCDTYSFGMVLLEVLCGRAAVDPDDKGKCSLSMWAMDNIDKGQVDHIVDPSLRGEISPNSLNRFVKIAQRCLHDEPEKRPAAVYIVTKLELALQQQEMADSLAREEDTISEDVFSSTDNADSLSIAENISILDYLQDNDTTSTRLGSVSILGTFPWLNYPNRLSNKTGSISISASDPASHKTGNTTLGGSTVSNESWDPTLRIFSIEEIKAAKKNFSSDTIIGEGGFGKVYKGLIHENPNEKKGSGSIVAVKKLNHESMQGFKEWQSEVKFLGKLSHPNLVKLLGYGWDDRLLFLVYEFMQKGSLDNHLSGNRGPPLQPMPWHIRLRIAIEAARGLAYLHNSDTKVIYRDFKAPNILLDELYNAKLSDFGLARAGPEADATHVSTQVMGTHGYVAPEYIATGHLTTKSDVYSFGVVLLELLSRRPAEQQNLVDWMKPHLSDMRKLSSMIDPCCSESAPQIAQLALNCLQMNPKCRPTMQQVVDTLESFNTAAQKP